MTGTPKSSPLGTAQRWVLVLIAVVLAIGLVILRGGIQSESPMEQLARRSLDPQMALTNGRPTLIEFYADWCQVCREMAPSMLDLEKRSRDRLDVVLVNVDNPRWQDLVDRYDVNGIPQLNLFDAEGEAKGRSIGLRSVDELQLLTTALIEDQPLPALPGVGNISRLETPFSANNALAGASSPANAGPRSHG
ncbi:thioredoxin domain-containing protein [Synechococcus sp. A15-62]|uniref:thioredoxin domain-containing protein n=1 Tax=Synechococcus sp. A15-62 TaxID=1050657 RepID=UPI00164547CD|nr:thioredoxin domain-containing protein [Synechococcus sp. A15-62]